MKEASYRPLARLLAGYSTRLRRGERVWIDASEIPQDFVIELIRAVRERGAEPFVHLHAGRISRELARGVTEAGLIAGSICVGVWVWVERFRDWSGR